MKELRLVSLLLMLMGLISTSITHAQDVEPAFTGLPRFERLFEKEGWAQSSFHCAIQDRTGFLWFGTSDGLLRYDGYSLKAFRYDPARTDSLAGNLVHALLQDRQGRIWVGSYGGGLNKFNPDTETFTRYQHDPDKPDTLSHNDVIALQEDCQGMLWIGMQGVSINSIRRLKRLPITNMIPVILIAGRQRAI
ncbi:MAG: hypothetical protein GY751_14725 [Bacteroidetes bacterium]|nr:hypothetical protein [Bacteroidota bacterium]